MKKIIYLVALLTVLACVSVGVSMAQQQKAAPVKPEATPAPATAAPVKLENFSGAITKVDEVAKVIDVKEKEKTVVFSTDNNTKITKGEKTLTFAALKAGMHVSVQYMKEGDKNIAAAIKVAAPKTP